jgi:transcriptional regulator with XRE-family HTH domain
VSAFAMVPIVSVQCWVARTALGWSERRLARAAGVSTGVVRDFERAGSVRATSVAAIQHALENAGVVFIDANDGGPGARLRKAD